MKLFKYNQFIKESNEDTNPCEAAIRTSINSICKEYGIDNYTINEDGSIDVDGNVILYDKRLTKLPLKFSVSGYFACDHNQLTSLLGSPISVGSDFYCHDNRLTSLDGCPQSVGRVFSCYNNELTNLEGSPKEVGHFACYNNKLTSLEGITKMRSGDIICYDNNIKDVRGIKEGWRGRLLIHNNPVYSIFKLFPEERYDEVVEYLNEYNVIRDGKVVVLQALEMVFHEMDLDIPQIEYIEGYEII
jgi:hypothetical protein